LRAARERKGLTVIEAADAMRLDQIVLEALERDDFAALGAPVFAKGHLRRYAALTGESADDLLLAYHQLAGVQEAPQLLDRAALLRAAERPSSGVPVGPFFALLIAGGLAGVWWWYEQPVERPTPIGSTSTTGALAAASIEPAPAADAASDERLANASGGAQEDAVTEAAASADPSLQITSATDEAGTSPTTAIEAGAAPVVPLASAATTSGAQAAEAIPPPVVEPSTPQPGDHSLVLRFTGESWAEVRDARGDRLYYDLGTNGSRRSLYGLPPFEIRLGNYQDVSVEMDGHARTIPADAVRGHTAHFTLDPT
jgi:cytoskeleton protein RodZ